MKLTSSIRRHTFIALTAICCLAATNACVTVEDDEDDGGASGSSGAENGSSGSGTGVTGTCSSACSVADDCGNLAAQGTNMQQCVAECQQMAVPQSILDCIVSSSCNAQAACLEGGSGSSSSSGGGTQCNAAEECPAYDCACGTVQFCDNGFCPDEASTCNLACS